MSSKGDATVQEALHGGENPRKRWIFYSFQYGVNGYVQAVGPIESKELDQLDGELDPPVESIGGISGITVR
jgi:hypothetical protein